MNVINNFIFVCYHVCWTCKEIQPLVQCKRFKNVQTIPVTKSFRHFFGRSIFVTHANFMPTTFYMRLHQSFVNTLTCFSFYYGNSFFGSEPWERECWPFRHQRLEPFLSQRGRGTYMTDSGRILSLDSCKCLCLFVIKKAPIFDGGTVNTLSLSCLPLPHGISITEFQSNCVLTSKYLLNFWICY